MSDDDSQDTPDKSAELTDRTLGDFRLIRRLGAGGMAEVYLAEQVSLGRSVAVKILRQDAVSGTAATLVKRFEQEARAAGGLSHPNIVAVYMIGEDAEDDIHYIVQEYIHGQNLSQQIKRHGPPDFLTGLKWMEDISAALKAADDAGVVHRDIKPENIMLARNGQAKVTDFGLAQLAEKTEKMNLTQAGTTMGTPWYMSPEQIQGDTLDHRADQYSLGITCYHMFAGQPPFPGKNSVSVAVQHLKEDPKPLRELRRDLPQGLCDVIHRMMEKNPDDRFESPEALQDALEKLRNAPVNLDLHDAGSFTAWLRSSMPSLWQLILMFVVCLFVSFPLGRNLFAPPRLRPSSDGPQVPRQETKQEQVMLALKTPDQISGWRGVVENFHESEEALWAQLRIGVIYLEQELPDGRSALRAFQELEAMAKTEGHAELELLSRLGQACASDQTDQLRTIADELYRQYTEPSEEAPQIVRNQVVRATRLRNDDNRPSGPPADRESRGRG